MSSSARNVKLCGNRQVKKSAIRLVLGHHFHQHLPKSFRNIGHGAIPKGAGAIFLILGALALVVLVLEVRAVVIGTQQQVLFGYIRSGGHSRISKQTLGKALETLRGALCVRVTELKRGA